jgi:FKBP-type peptidyl-prolyl cis-trans isomerase FklB
LQTENYNITTFIDMQTNDFDRISYALGLSMGNNFRASGIESLNFADFADGVSAVYGNGSLKMTYDEAKEVIRQYFEEMQRKQDAAAAAAGEVNAKAGADFLAKNGQRPEVTTTASGLQYEVLAQGNGAVPTAKDQVKVHYTGTLLDGTVFDSSVERGEPATFGVTQVIAGWVEALQLMSVGSKWRLYIPSNLAYGPNGAGGVIGPNATLIFDVELLQVL